ncbi:MAG: DUF433 domain-containing protein [Devosia sp.]
MKQPIERPSEHLLADGDGRIVTSSDVCGGRPRVKGTRVTVADLLAALAAGDTMDELVNDLPYISREDILAALKYAASNLDHSVSVAA